VFADLLYGCCLVLFAYDLNDDVSLFDQGGSRSELNSWVSFNGISSELDN
jgi:hypothetical protein